MKITRIVGSLLLFLITTTIIFAQEPGLRFSVIDDRGAPYLGLRPQDIRITLNKQVVQPTGVKIQDDSLNLLVLVDASVSEEHMLPFEKKAVEAFIDVALRAGKDRVGVAKFSNEISLVQDLSPDFAVVKSRLNAITFVRPPGYVGGGVVTAIPGPPPPKNAPGGTSLFDSIDLSITALSRPAPSPGRKAILVVSDGYVTSGEKRLRDVIEASGRGRIPLYAIGIGDYAFEGVDERTLKRLTSETGGAVIFPKKSSKLDEQVAKLANALRSSYVALFSEEIRGDVSIEILNPELKKKLRILSPMRF